MLFFTSWRGGSAEFSSSMVFSVGADARNLICSVHFLDKALAAASTALASCLQKECQTFLQTLADRLGQAASSGSVGGLYSILRPLYRKSAPRARSVFDCEGRATTTRRETALAFASHFSKMLDAEPIELHAIARRVCLPLDESVTRAAGPMDWTTVPSVSQLARHFKSMVPMKCPGTDSLGPELFHNIPLLIASLVHPIVLKSALFLAPPLQWRGGLMFPVWKGKQDPMQMSSFREVTCGDSLGKPFYKHLRGSVMGVLRQVAPIGQAGAGMNGGSTEMARLRITAARDIAESRRLSLGVLFLDLKSAFASITRQICLPLPESSDELASRLIARGFQVDIVRDFVATVLQCQSWADCGGSLHLQHLVAQCHAHTWFSLMGLSEAWVSRSGSLAGSPLGDVIFLLVHAHIMAKVREKLDSDGLLDTFEGEDGGPLESVGAQTLECADYMDDSAMPILAPASSIVAKVRAVARVFLDVFGAHCLSLSWEPGKTEALFCFMGSGTCAAREHLYRTLGAQVQLQDDPTCVILHATRCYKHLGTRTSVSDSLQDEISTRMGALRSAFGQLRKGCFESVSLSAVQKSQIAHALLFSRGLFRQGLGRDFTHPS